MNLVSTAQTICRVHSKDILIEYFQELYSYRRDSVVNYVLRDKSYQPSTLINAITWSNTREGWHYWNRIHQELLHHQRETHEELGF